MDRVAQAVVHLAGRRCGVLARTKEGYVFRYEADYLRRADAKPLSRSLPLREAPFPSVHFPGYFAGLVAEGWLQQQQSTLEKIDPHDYLTLLARNGEDLTGAVTVRCGDPDPASAPTAGRRR